MDERQTEQRSTLKVFISYSRKDEAFSNDLLAGLEACGIAPFLDRIDIVAGEDWEVRLGRLIETAESIVFIISPDSVASPRCLWEIDRAIELRKRVLPIVWRPVEEARVPERLRQLNYIFFDRQNAFGVPLRNLVNALRTDIDWVREHTRLGEAALRWSARGKSEALLISGDELASARAWRKAQPRYAPEPTLLVIDFIRSSEDAEAARNNAESKRLSELAAAVDRERQALRAGERALAWASGLFGCIVVGATGVYFQTYVIEQVHWYFQMGPKVLARDEERRFAAEPGKSFEDCKVGCPTMVVVPSGSNWMGSPINESGHRADEAPRTQVIVSTSFALGRTEVVRRRMLWDNQRFERTEDLARLGLRFMRVRGGAASVCFGSCRVWSFHGC